MSQSLTDSTTCWLDGEFLPADSTVLSSLDPGLMVGLGVFDSLCGYDGKPFDLEKHHARLLHDAKVVGLNAPPMDALIGVFKELMERNGFAKGRCRLRLSIFSRSSGSQSVVANVSALPQRKRYSSVWFAPYRVNTSSPLTGVKSSSYAANSLMLREAERLGADEALLYNTRGELCEGATSNLFLVKNDELYTPPLSSGCLPGVARDTVLEIARELGVVYHTRDLFKEDVLQCDEAFLTSSLRELQSIETMDGESMVQVDGGLVQRLRNVYQERAWA